MTQTKAKKNKHNDSNDNKNEEEESLKFINDLKTNARNQYQNGEKTAVQKYCQNSNLYA